MEYNNEDNDHIELSIRCVYQDTRTRYRFTRKKL